MAGGGGVLSSHRGSVQDFHHLVSRPDLNSSLQPADELRHCLLFPDADDDPLDELRIASRPAASVESSHKPRTLRPHLNNGFRSTPPPPAPRSSKSPLPRHLRAQTRGKATKCAFASSPFVPALSLPAPRFNIYIHDYCMKRGYERTANTLREEASIQEEPQPPINAKQGLLFE